MDGLLEVVLGGILGGILTLLAVLLTHMLQRRSVKEEAVLRRSEIVYEKQLVVLEEAVKNLAVRNEKWREMFRRGVGAGESYI